MSGSDSSGRGGCRVCELNASIADLPFSERLYLDDHWRIAHGWSALAGWLVLATRRHVESLGEMSAVEATRLGGLLRASTTALVDVVGCQRTYAILFAEQPQFQHVHIHVVPRMDWFTERDRGPAVFRHINVPDDERLPAEERDRLAAAIAVRLGEELTHQGA